MSTFFGFPSEGKSRVVKSRLIYIPKWQHMSDLELSYTRHKTLVCVLRSVSITCEVSKGEVGEGRSLIMYRAKKLKVCIC